MNCEHTLLNKILRKTCFLQIFTDNFYAKTYLQTGDYYTKLGKIESKDCAVFKWDNFENTTKMSYATPLILADPVDRRLKRMASNFK